MEFRQLRYFESVVRNKKITKAAQELHISQPSLSNQLKALEDELGCMLIERNSREIKLTEPGAILLKHTHLILNQYKKAKSEIKELLELNTGEISVGALPSIVISSLPRIISSFKKKYPNVVVHIHEMGGESIEDALKNSDIHIGINSQPIWSDLLVSEPIIQEELILIVSKEHHLNGKSKVNLEELKNESFIVLENDYQLRNITINSCKEAGFEPAIGYEGCRIEMLLSFTAENLGVSIVPETYTRHELSNKLKMIRIQNPTPTRTLCITLNKNRYISPAMVEFQKNVFDYFKQTL